MDQVTGKRCSACKYDMTGLPPVGRCPECGNVYSMVSGEGLRDLPTEQDLRDSLLRRTRTAVLAAATVTVLICSGLFTQVVARPWMAVGMGIFAALILALGTAISHLDEREHS
jgi:hypothetical protein